MQVRLDGVSGVGSGYSTTYPGVRGREYVVDALKTPSRPFLLYEAPQAPTWVAVTNPDGTISNVAVPAAKYATAPVGPCAAPTEVDRSDKPPYVRFRKKTCLPTAMLPTTRRPACWQRWPASWTRSQPVPDRPASAKPVPARCPLDVEVRHLRGSWRAQIAALREGLMLILGRIGGSELQIGRRTADASSMAGDASFPPSDFEMLAAQAYDEFVITEVIRPAAVLPESAARQVLVEMAFRDVNAGGQWHARPGDWHRYDRPWPGLEDPGGSQLLGSMQVAYGTPTRYEITIYRATITATGTQQGWTVESLCNEALGLGGLTLASCPRADLAPPPRPFHF